MVRTKKYLRLRMDREFKEISDFSTNEELVELLFIFESQPGIYKKQSI